MPKWYWFLVLFSVISITISNVNCSINYSEDPEEQVVKRVIKECTQSPSRVSCFANKAAKALEKSMDWDIPLFDGIKFARNTAELDPKAMEVQARSSSSGFSRFFNSIKNFLNTHTLYLDLTQSSDGGDDKIETGRDGGGGGGGGDGGGGGGKGSKKRLKREKKYLQYAFMVLLGIFGLTGPLVMKTLAIMAAKALIASKMALIIVGSVALKKIFEKDHHESPSVKVHTISADDHDHDRVYAAAGKQTSSPYWTYDPSYVKPT